MKLYEHQKTILNLLTTHRQFAIFAEQGTGKTLPVLYHITNLYMSGKIKNALIVAPLSVLGSWSRDIEKLPKSRKEAALECIEVINYDKVWRRDKYKGHFDVVVLDEAHNIVNRQAKRSIWAIGTKRKKNPVIGVNRRSEYRYILTGTPLDKGKLEQFYTLMDFLVPDIWGSYKEFSARYLIERQIPGTFVNFVVGYRHQDELLDIVAQRSFRILKKECLDLPEKLPPEIIVCENKEKKLYKEAEKSYIWDLQMNFANPLVKLAKLRQIASGFIIDDDGEVHDLKCQKYSILEELVTSILPSKVVIFANFKYSISKIAKMLDKQKIKYIILDGDTKDKLVWKKFQSDEDIKVFIGQYQSAKEGIDLFASTHVIYFEPCQDTRTLAQSQDRCHRIGVREPVNYYHLLTEKTVDESIYHLLEKGESLNQNYCRQIVEQGYFEY